MATTEVPTDSEMDCGFRPFTMNVERYLKLVDAGIFDRSDEVFLWEGRIVEKIRQGFDPSPDGNFPEHRLTIDRYLRMVEAGIFAEEDRVFLWEGRLVEKMTKGRRHSFCTVKINRLLDQILPANFHAELEQPMKLGNDSLPEPDVMVIRGTIDDFGDRIPTSGDVSLIIEVADSSVLFDSVTKMKAYATEGIPVFWIVNIPKNRIEVFARPLGACYQESHEYGPDDDVPVVLDGQEIGRIAAKQILR